MEPSNDKAKSRSGSEKRQRSHRLTMRFSPEEWSKLEERASAVELSRTAYMRLSAVGSSGPRARRRKPVDVKALAQASTDLNRVGNNLNQIARVLNRKESVAFKAIEATTADLVITLRAMKRAAGYDREG